MELAADASMPDQNVNSVAIKNHQPNRQNYIDWLRVGAMFLLLFYHTARLFNTDPWHIKNAVLSPGIDYFTRFLDIWHMPLFFILAGASVWFALEHRAPGTFTKERILRLFVPLIFGILVLVPPQVYVQRLKDGDFSGSFLSWYPHTFQGTYSMSDPSTGNLSWHHLWFLAYLFVFSLLLIPVFWYFKSAKRKSVISSIAWLLEKPGALFLPVIPLVIINLTLRPIYGWGNQNLVNDWANFLFYILVFFYGFLLVSDSRIIQAIRRNRYISVTLAIFTTVILLTNGAVYSLSQLPEYGIIAISCWCWLLAILGFGSLLLNFTNKILKYACDAVLPVYMLHQTIIVLLGYFVIRWNTGIAPKYLFIVTATLAISLAIYEIIRRVDALRFLFGMKIKKATELRAPIETLTPVLEPEKSEKIAIKDLRWPH